MMTEYSTESFETFLFDRNWLEPPLFYNNPGKVLRFNLLSKPEGESYKLLESVFDDIFAMGSDLYVAFFGTDDCNWKAGKRYFKFLSLRKIIKKYYTSRDEDLQGENTYAVLCKTKERSFRRAKYFVEYLRGEQTSCMVLISRKKSAALHFYDNRGFDLFSEDKDFSELLGKRYADYILNDAER